ncbi:MAG: Pleckstrin homology domain-containing protein [Olpidium bornovanus]|uniref:Pleckstrin homology domain-containing protein n=1 Tax=Olpidium bornovanus TaxID=278681 RepID=A0A8H7ZYG6_9FUNG|nr:MAG: Pleckstrin homology domain-containing protein [Olpidium bornovanus]
MPAERTETVEHSSTTEKDEETIFSVSTKDGSVIYLMVRVSAFDGLLFWGRGGLGIPPSPAFTVLEANAKATDFAKMFDRASQRRGRIRQQLAGGEQSRERVREPGALECLRGGRVSSHYCGTVVAIDTKSGPLYYRTGRRGFFNQAFLVLMSRHLMVFSPTSRAERTLQGIIPLSACYVYTGLGNPDTAESGDSGNDQYAFELDWETGELPRIFEDGTISVDENEECGFVLWRPRVLWARTSSISSAAAGIVPSVSSSARSWLSIWNRFKSGRKKEPAFLAAEVSQRPAKTNGIGGKQKRCEGRAGCCVRLAASLGFGRRFGRRGVNVVFQARSKLEAQEWVYCIEKMIEKASSVPCS